MTTLIGRDEELATLHRAIASPPRGQVITITGPTGSGRSTLLRVAAQHADSLGHRVLAIAGIPGESGTPLAGLHRLLRAVGDIEPNPHGRSGIVENLLCTSLFYGSSHTHALASTLLDTLDSVPRQQPVLVTVDDAQWLDEQSRDVLMFAARRSAGRPITMVLALPENATPGGIVGRPIVEICLPPLDHPSSVQVLEAQKDPPTGLLREQILTLADGNPAALVQFSRATAHHLPTIGRGADPLPLPAAAQARYAQQLAHLPGATRRALVIIAAASTADLNALDPAALADPDCLAPAEAAGFVRVQAARIGFVNPLIRSAAYYGAPLRARRAAHRHVADVLTALPYRRIWHSAQARAGADAELAYRLEQTYQQALDNDGYAAAAIVLQRSAALADDDQYRAQLLLQLAELARKYGDLTWAAQLSRQTLLHVRRSQDRIRALTELGLTALWNDGRGAFSTLLRAATEALDVDPTLAWEPLRSAAAATFLTDDPAAYQQTESALRRLDESGTIVDTASRLWIRAVTAAPSTQDELDRLAEIPTDATGPMEASLIGLAAGITDRSDLSVRNLRHVRSVSARSHAPHGGALTTAILAWSCVDSGRWDEALTLTDELRILGSYSEQPLVGASGDLINAMILARRGDPSTARVLLADASTILDVKDNRVHATWLNHALGTANLVEQNALAAYGHFSALFSDSVVPQHRHASFRGLVDFADAAVQADMDDEARRRFGAIVAHLPGPRSARLRQLVNHASALLSIGDVGRTYASTLADASGEQWPFERARVRLGYAGWLRRHRHRKDAQYQLSAAMSVFERLGAKPWLDMCISELRASGVRTTETRLPVANLTPQQHQVAYLVSQGLTNQQIAARLHLSVRTVTGYLYRIFPKLGVTTRNQIRDIPSPD